MKTKPHIAQSPEEIRSLAKRQWDDYRIVVPGRYFAEADAMLTLDAAYAVQMAVADLRCAEGDGIVGYKVGCIGSGVVEQFGMSGPIHARLFRSELRKSGDSLRHTSYANLAIEGEMALRIGTDGGIDAAFPVIELHHFVFRGKRKTLPELVANNGINAGAVVSDSMMMLDAWSTSRDLSVAINGTTIDTGSLWAMPGGAIEALQWLCKDLARFGCAVKAGDLVLAGTPLGLYPVRPGDRVVVSVDGHDYVECKVV